MNECCSIAIVLCWGVCVCVCIPGARFLLDLFICFYFCQVRLFSTPLSYCLHAWVFSNNKKKCRVTNVTVCPSSKQLKTIDLRWKLSTNWSHIHLSFSRSSLCCRWYLPLLPLLRSVCKIHCLDKHLNRFENAKRFNSIQLNFYFYPWISFSNELHLLRYFVWILSRLTFCLSTFFSRI